MKTAITNAKIYVDAGNFQESLLVEDGRIVAVGTNEEISAMIDNETDIIDANGQLVLPGFNDSHMHLVEVGNNLQDVRLLGVTSIKEVKARIAEFIKSHDLDDDEVIHGTGWNQDYFSDENRMLEARDLDEVCSDRPIIMERACAHILTANSLAMKLAGITKDTVACAGGEIDKDANGELTGIFKETACEMVKAIIKEKTQEKRQSSLRSAIKYAQMKGVTSVQTMDLRNASWKETLNDYEEVLKDEHFHVYHQCNMMTPALLRELLDFKKTYSPKVSHKLGCLKLFVDGSLGARTALMRNPYADDPTTNGIMVLNPDELDTLVQMADREGEQVVIHAIGDRGIEMVIDSYEKVIRGNNDRRHGIVHVQITDRALLERMADLDILALVQPIFLHYDQTIVKDRVGEKLASTSYAFKTMLDLGIKVSLGTDCPVEDLDPLNNIYCTITRRRLDDTSGIAYNEAESLTLEEAIDAYTIGGAYTEHMDDQKGRLKTGYIADLVILDRDIFESPVQAIKDTNVVLTMVDGHIVYRV